MISINISGMIAAMPHAIYHFPGPDAKVDFQARPFGIIDKLRQEQSLTASEAQQFLDWIVYEARLEYLKEVRREYPKFGAVTHEDVAKTAAHVFWGDCVTFRNNSQTLLNALSIPQDHHGFSVNSLGMRKTAHCAMTITLPVDGQDVVYLVDPTFRQFCQKIDPATTMTNLPAQHLLQMPDGPAFIDKLHRDGYATLTPEISHTYLAAFCIDYEAPFEDAQTSHRFMATGLRRAPV